MKQFATEVSVRTELGATVTIVITLAAPTLADARKDVYAAMRLVAGPRALVRLGPSIEFSTDAQTLHKAEGG